MKLKNDNLRLVMIFVSLILMIAVVFFTTRFAKDISASRRIDKANAFLLKEHDLQLLCFKRLLPEKSTEPFVAIGVHYLSGDKTKDPPRPVSDGLTGYPYKIGLFSSYRQGLYGGILPVDMPQETGEFEKEGTLYYIRFQNISEKGVEIELIKISGSLNGIGETFYAKKNKDGEWELTGPFDQWISFLEKVNNASKRTASTRSA